MNNSEIDNLTVIPQYHLDKAPDFPLDRWIGYAVKVLDEAGIEVYESCQGGGDHAYLEPTVAFHGGAGEGYRAFGIALTFGLPVFHIQRVWSNTEGELTGPTWEMTFRLEPLKSLQLEAEACGAMGPMVKWEPIWRPASES